MFAKSVKRLPGKNPTEFAHIDELHSDVLVTLLKTRNRSQQDCVFQSISRLECRCVLSDVDEARLVALRLYNRVQAFQQFGSMRSRHAGDGSW